MLRPQSLPFSMPDEQRAVAVFQRLAGRDFVRQSYRSSLDTPGSPLAGRADVPASPAIPADDGALDDRAVARLEFMYPSDRGDDLWFFGSSAA